LPSARNSTAPGRRPAAVLILILATAGILAGCTKIQKPVSLPPLQHGLKAYANEDYNLAIKLFTEAIDRNPNNTVAFFNRGNAYLAQRRFLKAIADYNQALKRQPRMAQAYHNRGLAKRQLGRIKAAIADYTRAIKNDPGYAQAFNNRGYAFFLEKNYFRAAKDYSQALTINPRLLIALTNRAEVYMAWGKYEKAAEDYSQVIEQAPSEPEIIYNRALAFERLKRYRLAAADLQKVLALNPKHQKAARLLARLEKGGLLTARPETPPTPGGMTPPTLAAAKKIPPGAARPAPTLPRAQPKPEPRPGPGPRPQPGPQPGPPPTLPRPAAGGRTMDIFEAAAAGNLAQVQLAVRRKPASVRQRDEQGATALHLAALSGKTDVISYLVSVGADINARDRHGHTPLYRAIKAHRAAAAALLARLGGRE
jgi:lipoprotein NlpI